MSVLAHITHPTTRHHPSRSKEKESPWTVGPYLSLSLECPRSFPFYHFLSISTQCTMYQYWCVFHRSLLRCTSLSSLCDSTTTDILSVIMQVFQRECLPSTLVPVCLIVDRSRQIYTYKSAQILLLRLHSCCYVFFCECELLHLLLLHKKSISIAYNHRPPTHTRMAFYHFTILHSLEEEDHPSPLASR